MSIHEADIKSRLTSFTERKAMPRHFEGKPEAQTAEIAELLATLVRVAPRNPDVLAQWWSHFEPILSERCGRNWPLQRDIREAARLATREAPVAAGPGSDRDMRPVAITARRMERGEPVGEDWLWGRQAVELALSGLVSAETVSGYRKRAFVNRWGVYGEDEARQWLARQEARHAEAKREWRERDQGSALVDPLSVREAFRDAARFWDRRPQDQHEADLEEAL